MGKLLEGWGEKEIQTVIREDGVLFEEETLKHGRNDETVEKRAEYILREMENSYQRLEKILKVFNRINRSR
jgi:hypothetical protein